MPPNVEQRDVEQLRNLLKKTGRPKSKSLDRIEFSDSEIDLLSRYYGLVLKWNKLLHLTTLTQPQEFLERHILESAFSESMILPSVNQVWDIGSGLGVPGMVIAILRPDLSVHMIEASRKKAVFLEETATDLRLKNIKIIESRFEYLESIPEGSCLTVRAIEGMEKLIPEIMRAGEEASQILLLGAKSLEEKARGFLSVQEQMESSLIPGSERRYVMNIFRST